MSPLMPARCNNCGHQWQPQGGILVENAARITFSNVSINCPKCGGRAQFLEGQFTVDHGAIQMTTGPQWSWDLVERLRLGLGQIAENQPDDPVAAVEALDPELGGRIRRATQGWDKATIIALLALIAQILQWNGVAPEDTYGWISEVREQINRVLEDAEESGPQRPSPPEPESPSSP